MRRWSTSVKPGEPSPLQKALGHNSSLYLRYVSCKKYNSTWSHSCCTNFCFCFIAIGNGPYASVSFPVYAEHIPKVGDTCENDAESPSTTMMCQEARRHGLWLIGGSIAERDGNKIYNTCVIVNKDGTIVGKHRKVHLFDIDVPGKIVFKESDTLSAGDSCTVIESPWGGIGIGMYVYIHI